MAFEMGLSLRDVRVMRGGRPVVEGASFDLKPGQVLQIRGSNGSGKTSLLRAIAGFARVTGPITFKRGSQLLDPGYIRSHEIHYIGMESGLSDRLTVTENARFVEGYFGGKLGEALSQLGLHRAQDRKLGALSSGQRRRLALLRLLTVPRALWLLDEPFAALDDDGRLIVRTLVDVHRQRGGMAIVALHDAENLPRAQTLRLAAP